jgi:large subunit ribosomal protein L9
MTELAKALQKLVCVIKVKTGEEGKLFGAVTNGMIADELKHQFDIALDKKKIHLEHSIRQTGEFEVELNLHHDVKGTLKVRVESTTPAVAMEAPPVEEKPKTEKRGKHHGHAEKAEAAPEAEAKPKTDKKPKTVKKAKAE